MKIQSPSTIQLAFKDVGEFTHGQPSMDLIDVTAIGSLSDNFLESDSVPLGKGNFGKKNTKHFMDSPGAYVYRLDLTLDSEKLQDSSINGFLVDILAEKPDIHYADNFDDIDNILNKSAIVETKLKQQSVNRLQVVIDYRSDLNNAKNKTLVDSATDDIEHAVITESRISNLGISSQPALKIDPSAMAPKIDIVGTTLTKAIGSSISAGLDPFLNLESFVTNTSPESKLSLDNTDIFPFNEDAVRVKNRTLLNEVSLVAQRMKALSVNYLSSGYTQKSEDALKILGLLSDTPGPIGKVQLGYAGNIVTKKFRLIRDIEIPKNIIGKKTKFFVIIKPIIESENTTDSVSEAAPQTFSVNHNQQLFELFEPVVPPTLSIIESKPGKIRLGVLTADPTSSRIRIARKVYDPRNRRFQSSKVFITDEGSIFDPSVDNFAPNKVYYTASTITETGASGPTSSIVVDGINNSTVQAKEDDNNPKLYAVNQKSGIEIIIDNVAKDIDQIALMREHVSGIGDYQSRLSAVSNTREGSFIRPQGQKRLKFFDSDVFDNHRYRYFLVIRDGLGQGYQSEDDDIIVRRYPRRNLPFEVGVAEPRQLPGQKLAIAIDMTLKQRSDSFEFFLDLLGNSGADKFFLDEIKKQRKSFSDVMVFLVERIDTETGRKVSLGLHGPGSFFDVASASGNLGLRPGKKYIYLIKVCVKPVESFFSNLFSSLTNPSQTTGTTVTKFLSKKFLDSANRHLGVIPSDFEIRSAITPDQQLLAAETGLTFTKVVTTSKSRASVFDFKLAHSTAANPRSVKLTWRLSGGDLSDVLYALVYCQTRSGKKFLGRVAINSNDENYYFVDSVKFKEVGTKTYTVRLVYNDLKISSPSKEIKITRDTNLPRSLIKDARFIGASNK